MYLLYRSKLLSLHFLRLIKLSVWSSYAIISIALICDISNLVDSLFKQIIRFDFQREVLLQQSTWDIKRKIISEKGIQM